MKKITDNFQDCVGSVGYAGIIESLRLFGVPTADELRQEFARRPASKDRAFARSKIEGKKALENFINLLRHILIRLQERPSVSKAKGQNISEVED